MKLVIYGSDYDCWEEAVESSIASRQDRYSYRTLGSQAEYDEAVNYVEFCNDLHGVHVKYDRVSDEDGQCLDHLQAEAKDLYPILKLDRVRIIGVRQAVTPMTFKGAVNAGCHPHIIHDKLTVNYANLMNALRGANQVEYALGCEVDGLMYYAQSPDEKLVCRLNHVVIEYGRIYGTKEVPCLS